MKQDLEDILRAEAFGLDLQDGPFGVHVYAMKKDGKLYELGSVSSDVVFQDPTSAMQLISKIKFERSL